MEVVDVGDSGAESMGAGQEAWERWSRGSVLEWVQAKSGLMVPTMAREKCKPWRKNGRARPVFIEIGERGENMREIEGEMENVREKSMWGRT